MAFKLPNGIVVDRVHSILFEKPNTGDVILCANNVSEFSIEVSADSTDAVLADGSVAYRKYSGKTATVSGTMTLLDMAMKAMQAGTELEIATEDAPIEFPIYKFAKPGEKIEIPEGTVVRVYKASTTYAVGDEVTVGADEADTTVPHFANGVLTLPAGDGAEAMYCVKYNRNVKSGYKYVNVADKMPSTVKALVKAIAVDPCDSAMHAYMIEIPRLQLDPSTTESLSSPDATFDFSGAIMADVCSADKTLYAAYFVTDEEEE